MRYKEIVTKAVIGKGKKTFTNKYELTTPNNIDTVLGCWVINHDLKGFNKNGSVKIKGSFDVNIWYSCENNTKTEVAIKHVNYEEIVNIKLKEESVLTDSSQIIIRALKNPNCIEANAVGQKIDYIIEKELGIEIIGDTLVKVAVEDNYDDYDIIEDSISENDLKKIDEEVNEDYLKS